MRLNQIIELPGKIKIHCDRHNWVLECGNVNNRSYFSTLDDLCDELLEIRLKQKAKKIKKDIRSLQQAVWDARVSVRNDLEELQRILTEADAKRKKGNFNKSNHG